MLGDKLKILRMKKGSTQQTVADYLCVDRVTYTNYERNKREPDIDTIGKLATYFDVSVDELLGNRIKKQPKELLELLDKNADATYDGEPLNDEDREKLRAALEIVFWKTKEMNKRKK